MPHSRQTRESAVAGRQTHGQTDSRPAPAPPQLRQETSLLSGTSRSARSDWEDSCCLQGRVGNVDVEVANDSTHLEKMCFGFIKFKGVIKGGGLEPREEKNLGCYTKFFFFSSDQTSELKKYIYQNSEIFKNKKSFEK